jgi:alkylhydroperoxidase family enzyme
MTTKPISRFPVPKLGDLPEDIRDRIRQVHEKAGFVPNVFTVLAQRPKVALDSRRVEQDDFAPLHAHGLSDEDVWDVGAIAAFFALSNRMANLTAMRPNDEFYAMGR